MFNYHLAECLNEHTTYNQPLKEKSENGNFNVDPFYADDTTFASINETGKNRLRQIEENVPKQLKSYNLTSNESKKEEYTIPTHKPPEPPPPSFDELLQHKNDKILWSDFDWLINYEPKTPKNEHPDWRNCKRLGSKLGTEEDIERR